MWLALVCGFKKKNKNFLIFAGVRPHQMCVDLYEISSNKSCQIIFNTMQIIS